jgi:hypothetical protein
MIPLCLSWPKRPLTNVLPGGRRQKNRISGNYAWQVRSGPGSVEVGTTIADRPPRSGRMPSTNRKRQTSIRIEAAGL